MAFAQTGQAKSRVFDFAFRQGSDVYEYDYQGNKSSFERLSDSLEAFERSGETYHFLLEVFVKDGNIEDQRVLNQQFFRAALIRSQLKTKLYVPYDQIAFSIRNEDYPSDIVRLTIVLQAISANENTDIFYSLSSLPVDIARALSRYNRLPFADSAVGEEPDLYIPPLSEKQMQAHAEVVREPESVVESRSESKQISPKIQNTVQEGRQVIFPPGAYPFNLGIKTNLLPWLGIVPCWGIERGANAGYTHGAPMYNGALEYYFADRYSVEASFVYAYSSYGGKKDNLWGLSVFTLEPRFWLNPDNSFRQFHLGIRMEYGDFDMKNNTPVGYGKTGRFYAAAFTAGYTLPIYRNFLVEGGVFLGYRNLYDGKNYRYDSVEKKNFYEDGFSEGTFVIGLSVSLLYRLGFW